MNEYIKKLSEIEFEIENAKERRAVILEDIIADYGLTGFDLE